MRKRVLAGIFAAFLVMLGVAPASQALLLSPNPVPFSASGITGTITFLGNISGIPGGGVQLNGTTTTGHITMLFQVSVTSGLLEILGVSAMTLPFTGVAYTGDGWVPGGGVNIAAATGTSTSRQFNFATASLTDGVAAGQTSDVFWVSYATLSPTGQGMSFMVDPGTGGNFNVTANIIPEPETVALLTFGLLALGVRRSRRG